MTAKPDIFQLQKDLGTVIASSLAADADLITRLARLGRECYVHIGPAGQVQLVRFPQVPDPELDENSDPIFLEEYLWGPEGYLDQVAVLARNLDIHAARRVKDIRKKIRRHQRLDEQEALMLQGFIEAAGKSIEGRHAEAMVFASEALDRIVTESKTAAKMRPVVEEEVRKQAEEKAAKPAEPQPEPVGA